MAQTPLQPGSEQDEKPRAMLFDGWDFVPIPEAEPLQAPAEAQAELAETALA